MQEAGGPAPGLRRFALLIEYDGSCYAGSQVQDNAPTVQAALEDAIEMITQQRTRVSFAGRTDSGVHAHGQVASFSSPTYLQPQVILRALNSRLPRDIVIRDASEVEDDFDPRRDAVRRSYRYVIDNHPQRPALERERAWHVARPLDAAVMDEAAQGIIGRHDFAAFAGYLDDREASTVRELMSFDVVRNGSNLICDLTATAFLPHQVRRMVGALAEVGKGKLGVNEYAGLLGGAPASAGPAAPAHGLYLMSVEYAQPVFDGLDSEPRPC